MRSNIPRSVPAPSPCLVALLAALCLPAVAEPQLTSWHTAQSGKYARIFTSKENEAAGITSPTWNRGQGTQASPTYSGVE